MDLAFSSSQKPFRARESSLVMFGEFRYFQPQNHVTSSAAFPLTPTPLVTHDPLTHLPPKQGDAPEPSEGKLTSVWFGFLFNFGLSFFFPPLLPLSKFRGCRRPWGSRSAPTTRQHPRAPRGPPHPLLGPQRLGHPRRPPGPRVPESPLPRHLSPVKGMASGLERRGPWRLLTRPSQPQRRRAQAASSPEETAVSDRAPKPCAEKRSARPSARVPAAAGRRRESCASRRSHAPCLPLYAPEGGASVTRVLLELKSGARLRAGLRVGGAPAEVSKPGLLRT